MILRITLALLSAILLWGSAGASPAQKIVLIGGAKSEGPGRHDYQNGIHLLEAFLSSALDASGHKDIAVDAYPNGWPNDPDAFNQAITVVWYFDGLDNHPLLDSDRRNTFEELMAQNVGLVGLHQSTTVPPDDDIIRLGRFMGGARHGMFDRTTEMVKLEPAMRHAVSRGVGAFTYRDEFYPTIRFVESGERITPVLSGNLHVQYRDGAHLVIDEPTFSTVAWAFERPGGGRSFAYTGMHYLLALDEAPIKKLLLNAVFWTAGLDVPDDGVSFTSTKTAANLIEQTSGAGVRDDGVSSPVAGAVVTTSEEHQVLDFPWGHITWYVSGELGNSNTMTVGQAVIKPGQENPHHYHPNCDEVLHVLKGHILQSIGDRTVEMREGDVVSIPTGMRHNAKNIGSEDAVLAISFSSADRKTVGE